MPAVFNAGNAGNERERREREQMGLMGLVGCADTKVPFIVGARRGFLQCAQEAPLTFPLVPGVRGALAR